MLRDHAAVYLESVISMMFKFNAQFLVLDAFFLDFDFDFDVFVNFLNFLNHMM